MAMNINKKTITKYARAYEGNYSQKGNRIEQKMKLLLRTQKYLTKEQLREIGSWKSPRIKRHFEKHNEKTVREITKFSFTTTSEEARILCLTSLKGVNFPVASTVLHFAFPNKYPIMDYRVIWSLGWDQPSAYNFAFWEKYCKKIMVLSKKFNLPIRTVEKALWMYSKKKQRSDSKPMQCSC